MAGTVLIVGGGVIGHASALALQRAGAAVTILDPMTAPSGASWGNAGHIAAEQPEPWANCAAIASAPRRLFWRGGALDFRLRDIDVWLPFAFRLIAASNPAAFARGKRALAALLAQTPAAWRRLAASLGDPGLYIESGQFLLWESDATARTGLAHWMAADIGTASLREATPAELDRLAALMKRRPANAIRYSGTGQISDPTLLAEAHAKAFAAAGGIRLHDKVDAVRMQGDTARLTLTDGTTLTADLILIAAGIRSSEILRHTGLKIPLIAERGYHIQAKTEDWPTDLGPLVFEDRSLIVTRFRNTVRAASFLEFGRPDTPPDPRKWQRLRDHIADIGLPFALPGDEWWGCRPTLPDYLPAIGRHGKNLAYAFGHQHLGLTLSAITGELVGAMASGETPSVPLAPFSLERFN
jgi:D-amino-acid dehydrogenase